METTAMDWKDEMDRVSAIFNRETRFSLGNIKMAFKRNGLSFNRKFREYFLKEAAFRITSAYDQFEIDSMHEEQINVAKANVSTVQSVDKLELGLVIKTPRTNGNPKQLNQPIEIDDSSDEETIHIKSETSESVSNKIDAATVNGIAGQLTNSILIDDSDAAEKANVSSDQQSHTTANQRGANQINEGGSDVLNDQRKSGENDRAKGGNDNNIRVKTEEDVRPKELKIDDDIPVVLVEVNRMFNVAIKNAADVDSNETSKKNNDDGGKQVVNSSVLTKKTGVDSIRKRPITSKSKSIQKSIGKTSAVKLSNRKKKVKCPLCDHVIISANLIRHMRTHTGEKPHRCDRCEKRFTRAESLKRHAVTHTDDFPFHCDGCLRGFSLKIEKEAHDKECKTRRYECHLCKKSVKFDISNLKIHMRSHTGEQPFRCEICPVRFTKKSNLKIHLNNIHARINP